ncbi:Uncharacterized protein LSUE1_G005738 [Lachnellula suecica]|uniref:Flavin reductase like domain-containing protein n=1 Tax=Lachnellula suecica TaxID=602035 RepID=A0A8T9C3T9_9HELO|nr:Uncharacterized protein LSUE1_G005738 [Lachnellula suecica]
MESIQNAHGVPKTSTISPAIFYWGTPVVLVSSLNEDGTTNISPVSSAWWLGNRCILGLGVNSHTTNNILRTKQCVLNLPSDNMPDAVNAVARTTGSKEILTAQPGDGLTHFKRTNGYEYVPDKYSRAALTPSPSDIVVPTRIAECPAQMEAELMAVHGMQQDIDAKGFYALEFRVLRTHVHDDIRMEGHQNRIDPDKWKPLIMSFQELYGVKREKAVESNLARITEEGYRGFSNPAIVEPVKEKGVFDSAGVPNKIDDEVIWDTVA